MTISTTRLHLRHARRCGARAARPAGAGAAEFVYKIGTSTPSAHPFNTRLMEVGERIARDTGGRMELQVFPDSQLGGDNDILSQARSGAIEFCQPTGQVLSSILPVTAINAMGFVFADYSQVWPAMDGELGKFVRTQIIAKAGLVPMERMWDLGFRQTTTSNRPVKHGGGSRRAEAAHADRAEPDQPVPRAEGGAGRHAVRRGLFRAADPYRRRPGEPALAGRGRQALRGAEIRLDDQPRLGRLLDLLQHPGLERGCRPIIQAIVAKNFNDVALLQRDDVAKLNDSVKSLLKSKGMVFNDTQPDSFRAQLRKAGFYAEWKRSWATRPGRCWSAPSARSPDEPGAGKHRPDAGRARSLGARVG